MGHIYTKLFSNTEPDSSGSAVALHHAVKLLRQQVGESECLSWVPFIHVGVWTLLEAFVEHRGLISRMNGLMGEINVLLAVYHTILKQGQCHTIIWRISQALLFFERELVWINFCTPTFTIAKNISYLSHITYNQMTQFMYISISPFIKSQPLLIIFIPINTPTQLHPHHATYPTPLISRGSPVRWMCGVTFGSIRFHRILGGEGVSTRYYPENKKGWREEGGRKKENDKGGKI